MTESLSNFTILVFDWTTVPRKAILSYMRFLGRSFLTGILFSAALFGQNALYQVNFGTPPPDGKTALNTFATRATAVLAAVACGDELGSYHNVDSSDNGEGAAASLVGKVEWYIQAFNQAGNGATIDASNHVAGVPPCVQTRRYVQGDFMGDGNSWKRDFDAGAFNADGTLNDPAGLASAFQNKLIAKFKAGDGEACSSFSVSAIFGAANTPDAGLILFTYTVPMDCLRSGVNLALMGFNESNGGQFNQAGTNNAVCWEKGFTIPGDWDVTVRDITRVYYLNKRWKAATGRRALSILNQKTSDYVRNHVLTLRKGPGSDSYGLPDCANAGDSSTGSPDATADEDNWLNNAVKSVGDGLGWLFSRALLFIAVIVITAIAGPIIIAADPATGASIVASLVTGGAVAAGAASLGAIPETENHRLMIETSRYLYDQLAAEESTEPGNAKKWTDYADSVREYLLKRMQTISTGDFIEYNARPYQRYSDAALLNLYDFSEDPQLQTAAQMLLEYGTMKFAVGSNQGRRSVPIRRRMESITGVTPIMELAEVDDYQVAQMLVLAGQTQQLPGGYVSIQGIGDMVYIASSSFRPDVSILDLAIRKTAPYYQQLSHSNVIEIYSGAASYVITAGGIEGPAAYPFLEAGVSLPGGGDFNPFISDVDRGAAVPSSLILGAGNGDIDRKAFLRFEGNYKDFGSAQSSDHPNWRNATYEHNTCVWKGFACGMNLVIPSTAGCTFEAQAGWTFINSANCAAGAPNFYVAIRRETCSTDGDDSCQVTPGNGALGPTKGIFEIVDSPQDDFTIFKNKVTSQNAEPFDNFGTATTGTYHSYSGHTIKFDCEAHQHDSDKWGITQVDGVDQPGLGKWPFASGDIIDGAGDGKLRFTNPGFPAVNYDFSDWHNPARSVK